MVVQSPYVLMSKDLPSLSRNFHPVHAFDYSASICAAPSLLSLRHPFISGLSGRSVRHTASTLPQGTYTSAHSSIDISGFVWLCSLFIRSSGGVKSVTTTRIHYAHVSLRIFGEFCQDRLLLTVSASCLGSIVMPLVFEIHSPSYDTHTLAF